MILVQKAARGDFKVFAHFSTRRIFLQNPPKYRKLPGGAVWARSLAPAEEASIGLVSVRLGGMRG